MHRSNDPSNTHKIPNYRRYKMQIFFLIKVGENKEKVVRKKNFTVSDVFFKCNSNLTFPSEGEEKAPFTKRAGIKNAKDVHRSTILYLKVKCF